MAVQSARGRLGDVFHFNFLYGQPRPRPSLGIVRDVFTQLPLPDTVHDKKKERISQLARRVENFELLRVALIILTQKMNDL